MLDNLTDDWKEWIQINLKAGCAIEAIAEAMCKAGFPHDDSVATIVAMKDGIQKHEIRTFDHSNPRFNHTGNVIQTSDREVKISMRSTKPIVAILDNFMTHEECDKLVELSKPKLAPSKVLTNTGGSDLNKARTSSGTYFTLGEDAFIQMIDKRIAEVMNWPVEKGEGIQVLNYQVGQEYKAHHDYFHDLSVISGGQRVATLVMYLNDVPEGGGTSFPKVGITAYPKKGSAVYFEYLDDNNQLDPLTLHAGDPVRKGEKWIATKWTRTHLDA